METLDSLLAKAQSGDKQAQAQLERLRPTWGRLAQAPRLTLEQQAYAKAISAKLTPPG